jgi:hypothetical protein
MTRNVGIQLRGGIAVARAVAGDRQLPIQVGKRRQRGNQHGKALARHHGADRQQPHDAVLAALRQRSGIATRPCDGDALGRHAIIGGDQPGRCRAGDDHALYGGECGPLTRAQRAGLFDGQPRFQSEWMMHQRQQRMMAGKLRRGFRQDAERKAIDDDGAAGLYRQQLRPGGKAGGFVGPWKTLAEVEEIDPPAELAELGDHAPVVGIAARRGREIARHGEREALHHKSASYQARATCDSEIVTRIAFSSRPLRPNSPARAPFAS